MPPTAAGYTAGGFGRTGGPVSPDATVADGAIPPVAAYGSPPGAPFAGVPSTGGPVPGAPGVGASGVPGAGESVAGPGQEPPARPAKPRRRKARLAGIIALIVVGLVAAGAGAGGLTWAYTRKPTPDQITAAGQRAVAQQWRWLTAGRIFPATISYSSSMGVKTTAVLVGIAPQASCASAFDAAAARVLDADRCVTVLRATYTDASHTALATIGLAVLPTAAAANNAFSQLNTKQSAGLLPVGFPGTIADKFGPKAREKVGVQGNAGNYLVFYAAGYADGRKTTAEKSASMSNDSVTGDLPSELATSLNNTFTEPANPCATQEVRCTP